MDVDGGAAVHEPGYGEEDQEVEQAGQEAPEEAALADAFETDVNALPLSLIISWYEQKAVADLLALLSLGIRGIYLGPTLPAFLSPNVLQYLVDTFDLKPISNAEDDLKSCLKQVV